MNIAKYRKFTFLEKQHCPILLTISGAELKDFDDGKTKVVIESLERYRVTLNPTNVDAVASLYGDETDDWIGERVGFVWDPSVEFKDKATGETQFGGIRAVSPEEISTAPAETPAETLRKKFRKTKLKPKPEPEPVAANNDGLPF